MRTLRRLASNAARENRSDPQRLLDDTPHLGKLHGVTICRELSDSDQIITCEHGGTDPRRRYGFSLCASQLCASQPPACPGIGEGPPSCTVRTLRRLASNAARENRSDPQRLLDDTPHLGKLHGVTICRELSDSDQIITCEHGGTDPRRRYGFSLCASRTERAPPENDSGCAPITQPNHPTFIADRHPFVILR